MFTFISHKAKGHAGALPNATLEWTNYLCEMTGGVAEDLRSGVEDKLANKQYEENKCSEW
uniref:Uncharacterized protein n=1 Tax=Heterorhabditis bacteriophora TaxID=37862 RepID=A0A1I7XC90_HETBA